VGSPKRQKAEGGRQKGRKVTFIRVLTFFDWIVILAVLH
jgi:hypothetical protein